MSRLWLLLPVFATPVAVGLLFVSSPIDPAEFHPPEAPGLSGPLAPNERLRSSVLLGMGKLEGAEDVEVTATGHLYGGVADGTIRRLAPRTEEPEIFATIASRPLGLDLDTAGTLWIAGGPGGLLSVDSDGGVSLRVRQAEGVPIGFANDVDTSADGRVYFSDSSTRFGPQELLWDALEARPHGRLLELDLQGGRTRVLLEGLYFANGVAVSREGRFLLVAETFRYRVRRYWLSGPHVGSSEVLVDNLPGFPDGISATDQGTFWVALYSLRQRLLDRQLHPRAWLKRLIAGLPGALLPSEPAPYGFVLEMDQEGRILRSLQDPGGKRIRAVTSVEEFAGALYIGSIKSDAVGRYDL